MVRVNRIENIVDRWGEKFLRKVFTDQELLETGDSRNKTVSYAGNFAVKEAFVKALGTGFRKGIKFHNIMVRRDEFKKPYIDLRGTTREFAEHKGLTGIHATISHDGEYSVAVVVLEN